MSRKFNLSIDIVDDGEGHHVTTVNKGVLTANGIFALLKTIDKFSHDLLNELSTEDQGFVIEAMAKHLIGRLKSENERFGK